MSVLKKYHNVGDDAPKMTQCQAGIFFLNLCRLFKMTQFGPDFVLFFSDLISVLKNDTVIFILTLCRYQKFPPFCNFFVRT
jgi:hypothetical protein